MRFCSQTNKRQLNLPGAGDITTGQAGSSDIAKKIKEGKVGGLFNICLFDNY